MTEDIMMKDTINFFSKMKDYFLKVDLNESYSPTSQIEITEGFWTLVEIIIKDHQNLKKSIVETSAKIDKQNRELFSIQKQLNIIKIFEISKLNDGWIGDDSKKIDSKIINIANDIVLSPKLRSQPEVFPTRRGTISMEFQPSEDKFIKVEIFVDKFEFYSEIDNVENEETISNLEILIDKINEFYSR